jgi:hypothetical protein
MGTTTTPDTGELRLALDDILVGDDVRDVDQEHVENLTELVVESAAVDRRIGEGLSSESGVGFAGSRRCEPTISWRPDAAVASAR